MRTVKELKDFLSAFEDTDLVRVWHPAVCNVYVGEGFLVTDPERNQIGFLSDRDEAIQYHPDGEIVARYIDESLE
jgi:hypothetical protein